MALSVILFAACGGSGGDESAGDAAKRQFGYISDGQFAREWEELHPAHQAVVTKEAWLDCVGDVSLDLGKISVKETFPETLDVPEVGEVETTAVTLSFTIGDSTDSDTFHEVATDDGWRWIMDAEGLDAYRDGDCPS